MDKQQLEAIRARDADDYAAADVLRNIRWAGNTDPELEATINMIADRRDLLAAYDAIAAEYVALSRERQAWLTRSKELGRAVESARVACDEAQEELRKCQQDAIQLQAQLAATESHAQAVERRLEDYIGYVAECNARLAEAERDADQLLKERDHAEGMADKLADALATMLCVDIGEHSSGNCPWTEALEAFEERATDSASHLEPIDTTSE